MENKYEELISILTDYIISDSFGLQKINEDFQDVSKKKMQNLIETEIEILENEDEGSELFALYNLANEQINEISTNDFEEIKVGILKSVESDSNDFKSFIVSLYQK